MLTILGRAVEVAGWVGALGGLLGGLAYAVLGGRCAGQRALGRHERGAGVEPMLVRPDLGLADRAARGGTVAATATIGH